MGCLSNGGLVVMLAFVSEPDGTVAVHSPLKFRVPVTWLKFNLGVPTLTCSDRMVQPILPYKSLSRWPGKLFGMAL